MSKVKKRAPKLGNLSEMHQDIKEIKEQLIPSIRTEIAVLKVKNTTWSAVTGILGGALVSLGFKLGN